MPKKGLLKIEKLQKQWDRCASMSLEGPFCDNWALYSRGLCWEHLKLGGENEKNYVDDVLTHIEVGQLEGVCLRGVDFSGRVLKNAVFVHCDISWTRFDNCMMQNAYFEGCMLEDTTFINANLARANFTDCIIPRANFSRASFVNCFLYKSEMQYTHLVRVDLTEGLVNDCDLSYALLTDSIMDRTQFRLSKLIHARFDRALAREAIFDNAKLGEVSFVGADLSGASFKKADLSGAKMGSAICIGANFVGADISDADLEAANLANCKFSDQAFLSANVLSAIVDGVKLEVAGLKMSDVMNFNGHRIVVRKFVRMVNPSRWSCLWDYPIFRSILRLNRYGTMRGYEYLAALLTGGGFVFLLAGLGLVYPSLAFWVGFITFILFYRSWQYRMIKPTRKALMYIMEKLSE